MKSEYIKPMLFAERFAFSEHIANCVHVVNFQETQCSMYDDNGLTLFASGDVCGADADSMWTFAGVTDPSKRTWGNIGVLKIECYNSFHETNKFFTS